MNAEIAFADTLSGVAETLVPSVVIKYTSRTSLLKFAKLVNREITVSLEESLCVFSDKQKLMISFWFDSIPPPFDKSESSSVILFDVSDIAYLAFSLACCLAVCLANM